MLKPLENKILIVALEDSKSVVVKAETKEKDRPMIGKIIALGKEFQGESRVGDVVYFQKFNVEEIEHKGKLYYAAIREDLLAVVK